MLETLLATAGAGLLAFLKGNYGAQLAGTAGDRFLGAVWRHYRGRRNDDFERLAAASLAEAARKTAAHREDEWRELFWRDSQRKALAAIERSALDKFLKRQGEPERAVLDALLLGRFESLGERLSAMLGPELLTRNVPHHTELLRVMAEEFIHAFSTLIKQETQTKGRRAFHRDLAWATHRAISELQEELAPLVQVDWKVVLNRLDDLALERVDPPSFGAEFERVVAEIHSAKEEVIEEIRSGFDAQQRTVSAEREWGYVETHPIRNVTFLLLLKHEVGIGWFRTLLDDATISFHRDRAPLRLSTLLAGPPTPLGGSMRPGFWRVYDGEGGYWCKRTTRESSPPPESVAGIDGVVPWGTLAIEDVAALRDLPQLTDTAITLPARAFDVGVEELEIYFAGDTFSFQLRLSEQGLDSAHELAHMPHPHTRADNRIPVGISFSGVRLLEIFRAQFLSQRSGEPLRPGPSRAVTGLAGPEGREIAFYPGFPLSFHATAESKQYSFTVTVQRPEHLQERLTEVESAIRAGERSERLYLELAALQVTLGRPLDAVTTLSQALREIPPGEAIHIALGRRLMELGREQEAFGHFRRALDLAPDSAAASTALAVALATVGKNDEALEHFQAAANIAPSAPGIQKNLGMSLVANGRCSDAAEPLRMALAEDPGDRYVMKLLASILEECGDVAGANVLFEQAAAIAPPEADAYFTLALHYGRNNEIEKSVSCLERTLAIDKHHARAYEVLGGTLANLGRWDDAVKALRRALELSPEDKLALAHLGAVLTWQGQVDAAIPFLEKALELDNENPDVRRCLERARAVARRRQG